MPENPLNPEDYARLTGFDGKWRDTWWRRDFLELCVKRWRPGRPQSLLDVGCGAGHWGRALAGVLPGDPLLAGVDIEPDFVDRARDQAASLGLSNVDYRLGAAEKLPFPDDRFDLVTCQTVLIHVASPESALTEMRRVLRPDGVLVVAEPNNVAGCLSYLMAEPRPEWDLIRRLVDFYHVCLVGKAALGMGDSSVGERLPALLQQAGYRDISIAMNENTPALVPPYADEDQRIEREFLQSCMRQDIWWMGFGPRANALRFFLAGGGGEAAFDPLWGDVMALQRSIVENIDAGRYSGCRGVVMYLVAARK